MDFKKQDLMRWQSAVAGRAGPISQLGWRDGRSRESASLCCLHTASAPGKLGLIGLSGSPWEGSWRLLPPDLCESLRKHPCLGWPWDTLFTPPRRVLEAQAVYFSLRRLNKDITDSLQYYVLFPREALSTINILTPK